MSLPLAGRASHLTAVDGQADMLTTFAEAARAAGVEASTILGRWPDVAGHAPMADVVTSGHVAYNVAVRPVVSALYVIAGRRVVMELTDRHPLAVDERPPGSRSTGSHVRMRLTDADAVDVSPSDRVLQLTVEREARTKPLHGGRRRVRASRGCDRARPSPALPAGGPRRRGRRGAGRTPERARRAVERRAERTDGRDPLVGQAA